MSNEVRYVEVFDSISGEQGVFAQGGWATFVRFAGCNLRCRYCDTQRSYNASNVLVEDAEDLAERMMRRSHPNHIIITGGEPMLQQDALKTLVMGIKRRAGVTVSVETNGTIDLNEVDRTGLVDAWLVDWKLRNTLEGEVPAADDDLHRALVCPPQYGRVCVKFLVSSRHEYEDIILHHIQWIKHRRGVARGMCYTIGALPPITGRMLFGWMRDTAAWRYNVTLNAQLHKLLHITEDESEASISEGHALEPDAQNEGH